MLSIVRRATAALLIALGWYGLVGGLWIVVNAIDAVAHGVEMAGALAIAFVPLGSITAVLGLAVLRLGVLA